MCNCYACLVNDDVPGVDQGMQVGLAVSNVIGDRKENKAEQTCTKPAVAVRRVSDIEFNHRALVSPYIMYSQSLSSAG